MAPLSRRLRLSPRFVTPVPAPMHRRMGPTTPTWQRHRAITPRRFRLFPFRSPLLRESLLLSSPRGTEMFQFPRLPLLALCVQTRVNWALPQPGFPIRTSPGQSLLDSSPRLFAACHVLHRLLAPRHPPSTRSSLDCIEYIDFRARYAVLKEPEKVEGDLTIAPGLPHD